MLYNLSCFDLQSQTILLESYGTSLCICRYLSYWKVRFKEKPIKEFCPVININSKPGGKLSLIPYCYDSKYVCCNVFYFYNINIRMNFEIKCKEVLRYTVVCKYYWNDLPLSAVPFMLSLISYNIM